MLKRLTGQAVHLSPHEGRALLRQCNTNENRVYRSTVSLVSSALRTTGLTTSLHFFQTVAIESAGEDAAGAAGYRLCAFRRGRMGLSV